MNKTKMIVANAVLALSMMLAMAPRAVAAETKRAEIPKGYRLLTLPVKQHQLLELDPGDRVDVMVTFEALVGKEKPQSKEIVTATLLQNVIVQSVYSSLPAVSLVVNPNEAQYGALAIDQQKSIWLIKRGKGDKKMHPMEMASFRKLFR